MRKSSASKTPIAADGEILGQVEAAFPFAETDDQARAIDQARAGRGGVDGKTAHTPADELRLLAVHGALHLCGWDHGAATAERAMWAEQERILRAHSRAMRHTLARV